MHRTETFAGDIASLGAPDQRERLFTLRDAGRVARAGEPAGRLGGCEEGVAEGSFVS
jgi:hypothetical protein